MVRYLCGFMLVIWLLSFGTHVQAQTLAFPSAEGFGRFATGGRGGSVCKVTNLNDRGAGSLRDCLGQSGPRTIVFAVSGIIILSSPITVIPNDVTIACQTAPGQGVLIHGRILFSWAGTRNIIMRYCRMRMGEPPPNTTSGGMTIGGTNAGTTNNMIFDHLSVGWVGDDMFGIDGLNRGGANNITIQWSIFSETIYPNSLGSGGANWIAGRGDLHVSVLHNLYANVNKRTPHVQGGNVQIVNNVVHNASTEDIYMLALYNPVIADIVNNWMNPGPLKARSNIMTVGCGYRGYAKCNATYEAKSNLYIRGNVHTSRRPDASTGSETAMLDVLGNPYPVQSTTPQAGFPTVTTDDAVTAKNRVLANAGAVLPFRDAIDQRAISDVQNDTGRRCGKSVSNAVCLTWPTYASGTVPADSDNDGIPNTWELSHGLNLNDPSDGRRIAANGYTNLENFLNELAGDDVFGSRTGPTPVAHYSFDNTANDAVGTYHGTLFGSPTFTAGRMGQAIALDGTHDHVRVAHSSSLNPASATTIATWFKSDVIDTKTKAGDTILMKGDWNFAKSYFLVFYQNNLRCGIGTSWNKSLTYAASNFVPGQWYHLACRADGSGHTLFVNGNAVASNAVSAGSVPNTNVLVIGANGNPSVGHFNGLLDDLRLYTIALSNTDIQALASLNVGVPPPRNLQISTISQ